MSKALLITDSHFGVRADSLVFHKHFAEFYAKYFFPLIEQEKPVKIIHLGDLFDRRKYVNFQTLSLVRKYFLDPLRETGLEMDIILGNHDTYFKNTNDINSVHLLTTEYKNINLFTKPEEIKLGNLDVLYLPWIPNDPDEQEVFFRALDDTKCKILMAHLDINGFDQGSGVPSYNGFDRTYFDKFKMVLSGHYHIKQTQDTIHYLGSPYEMTWSDYNLPRGLHFLDLDTGKLEFKRIDHRLFYKIIYSPKVAESDLSMYTEKYIQVIRPNRCNNKAFEIFLDRLAEVNPANVQIREYTSGDTSIDEEIAEEEMEDTLSILKKSVDESPIDGVNVEDLKNELIQLYNAALDTQIDG